ncbi:non-specific lipid-transfer protein 4.1-like [Nymphaea colorata]|nr:non-specific lipid-transfer protein 4.1-like [Nymphaea colorata]
MASLSVRAIACIFLACLVSSRAAPLSCSSVVGAVTPCFSYIAGGGATPPAACCSGLRQLKGKMVTKADKAAACQCLKKAAATLPGIDYGRINKAVKYCKVGFPSISPGVDCKKF